MEEKTSWDRFTNNQVVVDTDSSFVYIGTLKEVDEYFVTLSNVDVHDKTEGSSTNERYIMEAKKWGIKANRKEVSIRKNFIISISRLSDVIEY